MRAASEKLAAERQVTDVLAVAREARPSNLDTASGGLPRDQTKDAFWPMSAAVSMDDGVDVQLGGDDAAGTVIMTQDGNPIPSASPLVAYLNTAAGLGRAVFVANNAVDCYDLTVSMSLSA